MKLIFLGTGTSVGVPSIGCQCRVCRSNDPHDKRLRCSALVETDETRILIDVGPDFRQQILQQEFRKIDAVLATHIHYDHVAGIDDLRPFCAIKPIEVYANRSTFDALHQTMPYCFGEHLYPGVPLLNLNVIEKHQQIVVGDLEIVPIEVMHGKLPILAFIVNQIADGITFMQRNNRPQLVYITDMKTISDEEIPYIDNVETLVVNGLRFASLHHSHQTAEEAQLFAKRVNARQTYLTHMGHDIGLHKDSFFRLDNGVELAYDNLRIEI